MAALDWWQWVVIFLLSTVKLIFAPGTAVASGFSFLQTFAITSLGGITGVLFFYFAGIWVMDGLSQFTYSSRSKPLPRRRFSRRNRKLIHLKQRYGLWGLAVLTPCIISIPIGAVVAARFFRTDRRMLPSLLVSVVVWCFALTLFSFLFKSHFLQL